MTSSLPGGSLGTLLRAGWKVPPESRGVVGSFFLGLPCIDVNLVAFHWRLRSVGVSAMTNLLGGGRTGDGSWVFRAAIITLVG